MIALLLLATIDSAGFRAAAELEKQDEAQALVAYEKLIARNPAWELPRLEAARLRLKRGDDLELAEAHLEAARALAPENPRAHYLFALLMEEKGLRPEAQRSLEVALTLRPDYDDARFRLAGLCLSGAEFSRAVELYAAHLKAHPDAVGARIQLALALERSGDVKAAERELKSLMTDAKTRALAGQRLVELYERAGRHKDAEKTKAALFPSSRKLRALKPSAR